MQYVYVKDSEGYVSKKLKSEVCKGEKIISEKAYLKIQMRVTKEEKDFHLLRPRTRLDSCKFDENLSVFL